MSGGVTCAGRLRRAVDDDEGSMTVTAAFAAAAVLALTVAVLLVGRAAVAAHSAQAAADLAALAGARALLSGEEACAVASRAAEANRASVVSCAIDADDVVVRAEVRVALGAVGVRAAAATARAGPV